jgi:hypothetical protein
MVNLPFAARSAFVSAHCLTVPVGESGVTNVTGFGELVADPSRVAMLLALMDGSARPASELAGIAGVTTQTASALRRRLVEGGLLAWERLGRHRCIRWP